MELVVDEVEVQPSKLHADHSWRKFVGRLFGDRSLVVDCWRTSSRNRLEPGYFHQGRVLARAINSSGRAVCTALTFYRDVASSPPQTGTISQSPGTERERGTLPAGIACFRGSHTGLIINPSHYHSRLVRPNANNRPCNML